VYEHVFAEMASDLQAKPEARAAARRLRLEGRPLKRIAAELGVSVNSAHRWTADIQLTPEQVERNRRGPGGPMNPADVRARAVAWSARCRAERESFQADGRAQARQGHPLHRAGCMLYWAEGTKGRNAVEFSNSDVAMMRLFRRFLVEALAIEPDELRVALNVYTGNGASLRSIESHWLAALELPRSCLRKHTVNRRPTSSSGRAKNRLPYGVCTLRVHSTWAVQHIYGAIQEYAGFHEPRWLD
jgi:hypothetical protein